MYAIQMKCGICEHTWDARPLAPMECPVCRSSDVNVGSFPTLLGHDCVLGRPLPPVGIARPTLPADAIDPASPELAAASGWAFLFSLFVGIALGVSGPVGAMPAHWLYLTDVIFCGATLLGGALAYAGCVDDGHRAILATMIAQAFVSTVTWIGTALLLGIWWPTASRCCLLIWLSFHLLALVAATVYNARRELPSALVQAVAAGVIWFAGSHLAAHLTGIQF